LLPCLLAASPAQELKRNWKHQREHANGGNGFTSGGDGGSDRDDLRSTSSNLCAPAAARQSPTPGDCSVDSMPAPWKWSTPPWPLLLVSSDARDMLLIAGRAAPERFLPCPASSWLVT
jgi:hypothetical protein